jgi:hypothetical protein
MAIQTDPLTDRNGLQILTREECLALLGAGGMGRVGVTMRALPVILPVNYAVYDGDVVFRTGAGTKLAVAVTRSVVAFEADWFDTARGSGWSVCVTGLAEPVTSATDLMDIYELPFQPLPEALRQHVVRIRTHIVSGRLLPGEPR